MNYKTAFDAAQDIKSHLFLHQHSFFNFLRERNNSYLSSANHLERIFERLEESNYLEEDKMHFVKSLSRFLADLETYYKKHTKEDELNKLAKYLHVTNNNEISFSKVDDLLKTVAHWFTTNSIFMKYKRIVKEIDQNLEFKGLVGEGDFAIVFRVIKNHEVFALKVLKNSDKKMYLQNPEFGHFKVTLKQEFEIMENLWNHGLKNIPKPIKLYKKSPSFLEENKLGHNSFLMTYIKGNSLSYKSLSFSEINQIRKTIEKINSIGYIIPFDFIRNIIVSENIFGGLFFLDFAGYLHNKHYPEEQIRNYQLKILSELELKYAA